MQISTLFFTETSGQLPKLLEQPRQKFIVRQGVYEKSLQCSLISHEDESDFGGEEKRRGYNVVWLPGRATKRAILVRQNEIRRCISPT